MPKKYLFAFLSIFTWIGLLFFQPEPALAVGEDLTVTGYSTNPPTNSNHLYNHAGTNPSFEITIKNIGTATVNGPFRGSLSVVSGLVGGETVSGANDNVPSISPGQSTTVSLGVATRCNPPNCGPWNPEIGEYGLNFCADSLNAITETNESNNCLAINFWEVISVDLRSTNPTVKPGSIAVGTPVTFGITIQNAGLGSTYYTQYRNLLQIYKPDGSGDFVNGRFIDIGGNLD